MSKIETRTVLPGSNSDMPSLNDCTFYIKDYQRGYRWEEQQIENLLQDLLEFNHHNHTVKYCMQPLVVKKIETASEEYARELSEIIGVKENIGINDQYEHAWELIDGQQRLTTTLLILNSCNENSENPPRLPYQIFYSLVRNIDEYYINNAKKVIDRWFGNFGNDSNDKEEEIKKKKEEIRSKINSDIQFIWYEVDSTENSVDIFTKLNIGKIPLTNAELFKAQLLNPDSIQNTTHSQSIWYEVDSTENSVDIFTKLNIGKIPLTNVESFKAQLLNPDSIQNVMQSEMVKAQIDLAQIAFEWDRIEQSLRDDELWSFISNESRNGETRIDYLLKLYAIQLRDADKIESSIQKEDVLFPFLAINEYIRRKNPSNLIQCHVDIWEQIVAIHDKLKSWYSNNKLFHYIGFLIAVGKSSIEVITNLIRETANKKKSEVEVIVFEKIKEQFSSIVLDELSYHKDKQEIRKVLLFFNLFTMMRSKADGRFSFKQYKDPKIHWDIEHIHARATDEEIRAITEPEKRKEFLKALEEQFKKISDKATVEKIEEFIAVCDNSVTENEFLKFCCEVTDKYGDFDENGLGNLTLLDAETNRSYQNALYPVKRNIIFERDREVFIPVCTKNVFLKMYSSTFSNMMEWTKDDADAYLEEIKKALVKEAKVCQ